jgi:hypothetical protein
MQAFHNDKEVRKKYLTRVKAHAKADEIIKGVYWEGGKGCAVGCTIHSSNHESFETELGVPEWLARVEDRIFEGLPNERAKTWPVEFLQAINLGADLNKIKPAFLIFVLESCMDKFDHEKYPRVKESLEDVIALYELDPERLHPDDWSEVRSRSYAAAVYAAAAAYAAAAVYAAAAYAAAAVYAAADAAAVYAAADAAAYAAAARRNTYILFADKLLELIRECR